MSVRNYQPDQEMMYFLDPAGILGKNHLCFIVDEIVENLDLSSLPNKQGTTGAPNYDYRLLIKVLFYGYSTGTFSSRKLMNAIKENVAHLYLTRQQVPNFRTISDFRKNYRIFLEESFVNIVKAAKETGMVSLGTVSIDSTKIRANAANKRTFTHKELEEQKKKIEEAIEEAIKIDEIEDKQYGRDKTGDELPEELQDRKKRIEKIRKAMDKINKESKKKINLTDNDTNFMKDSKTIQTNYNCHVSVDEKENLIVTKEVTTEAADVGGLEGQVDNIEETLEEKPENILADSGYYSIDNLEYLDDNDIKGYIPHPNNAKELKNIFKDKKNPYDKQHFKYNTVNDYYICPEGKVLKKKTINSEKRVTLYCGLDCPGCKKRKLCTKGQYRFISRHEKEHLIIEMRKKLKTKRGKKKYSKRSHMAETPFGHIKKNLGFRQFFCRGKPMVAAEFTLICIGYNIKKLTNLITSSTKKKKFYTALA